MGQPDVRVRRDQRLAVGAGGRAKSGSSNSPLPPQRRPVALGPAEDRLLLAQRGAVPGLDHHPDLAGDQVGATVHPGRSVARLRPTGGRAAGRSPRP